MNVEKKVVIIEIIAHNCKFKVSIPQKVTKKTLCLEDMEDNNK